MPANFKKDLICILILLAVFIPLYALFLYEIPYQVNTDEITIMIWVKRLAGQQSLNWFGLSDYLAFPSLIFIVFGKIGQALGGINLQSMRSIHSFFGLSIVLLSFVFFRLFLPRWQSAAASLVLGVNHSLISISRMAMRDNSGLLLELIALTLFYSGFKSRQILYLFLGSLVSGLALYAYSPGGITIIIWLAFSLLSITFIKDISRKFLIKALLLSSLGFGLVATPLIISSIQAPSDKLHYQRQQLLIYDEGRKMQKEWVGASSEAEGVIKNITNGLTVFNNNKSDYAYIYPNPKYGFVDPLTGILVWLGVIVVIFHSVIKRKLETSNLLNLTGLATLLFIFSVISNKAPNYTRLLVILPFAAYFVVKGLMGTLGFLKTTSFAEKSLLFSIISLIMFWNLSIFYEFVQKGFTEGNDVGGTARYIEARNNIAGYKFYLSADNTYPYYGWGGEWQWRGWIGFFAGDNQDVQVLSPADFIVKLDQLPFTVFMSKILWSQSKANFITRYPSLQIHHIKPDGSLVAIEVK